MSYYVVVNDDGEKVTGTPRYEDEGRAEVDADKWTENREGVYTVEERDETTDDSQTTMSNYDFISNDDETDDNQSDDQFTTVGNKWTLGDHSSVERDDRHELSESIRQTMDALDDDVDGDLKAVLEDASDLVEDTSISRFECPVEACGLGHSHPDHKHDIRSAFNVLDSFTSQMEFCAYCHCGVNELSMLMAFFPYITEPVFTDQHEFEGVLEVEPNVLEDVYRRFNDGASLSRAATAVGHEHGADDEDIVPLDVRKDMKRFFERRQEIENAANAAPIAQETRSVITQNREVLEEQTSQ